MSTGEIKLMGEEEPPDSGLMLADWGAVARRLGGTPDCRAYEAEGRYRAQTLCRYFGSWLRVGRAFMAFAAYKPEWGDVVALCAESLAPGGARYATRGRPARTRRARMPRRGAAGKGTDDDGRRDDTARPILPGETMAWGRRGERPVCGEPLGLPAMRNAPVNEIGVMLLFGAMAERLGFCIEAARAAYPDCEAKRRVGPGEWQTVRIEFEYESRNFRDHGHDPEGCDVIVCWAHNWAECPANLEVVALRDFVSLREMTKHEADKNDQ